MVALRGDEQVVAVDGGSATEERVGHVGGQVDGLDRLEVTGAEVVDVERDVRPRQVAGRVDEPLIDGVDVELAIDTRRLGADLIGLDPGRAVELEERQVAAVLGHEVAATHGQAARVPGEVHLELLEEDPVACDVPEDLDDAALAEDAAQSGDREPLVVGRGGDTGRAERAVDLLEQLVVGRGDRDVVDLHATGVDAQVIDLCVAQCQRAVVVEGEARGSAVGRGTTSLPVEALADDPAAAVESEHLGGAAAVATALSERSDDDHTILDACGDPEVVAGSAEGGDQRFRYAPRATRALVHPSSAARGAVGAVEERRDDRLVAIDVDRVTEALARRGLARGLGQLRLERRRSRGRADAVHVCGAAVGDATRITGTLTDDEGVTVDRDRETEQVVGATLGEAREQRQRVVEHRVLGDGVVVDEGLADNAACQRGGADDQAVPAVAERGRPLVEVDGEAEVLGEADRCRDRPGQVPGENRVVVAVQVHRAVAGAERVGSTHGDHGVAEVTVGFDEGPGDGNRVAEPLARDGRRRLEGVEQDPAAIGVAGEDVGDTRIGHRTAVAETRADDHPVLVDVDRLAEQVTGDGVLGDELVRECSAGDAGEGVDAA